MHVVDQGSVSPSQPDILPDANGMFSAQITLDTGTAADPDKGWHKLVFDQGGAASPPGVRQRRHRPAHGRVPAQRRRARLRATPTRGRAASRPGRFPIPRRCSAALRVMEETGRQALRVGRREDPDHAPSRSRASRSGSRRDYRPRPGPPRPLLLPGARAARRTPRTGDRRALPRVRGLADTPTSRIVVDRQAAALPDPAGPGGRRRAAAASRRHHHQPAAARPGRDRSRSTSPQCGPNANPPASPLCARCPTPTSTCASAGALYTDARRRPTAAWSLTLPLRGRAGTSVTFAQVLDSRVGGAWSESCLSNEIDLGVRQAGGPVITVPADITVDATGPQGAQVFYPDVTAVRATTAHQVPVDCAPAVGLDRSRLGRNAGAVHGDRSGDRRGRPRRVRDHRRRRAAVISPRPTSSPRRPAGGRDAEQLSDVTASDAVDRPCRRRVRAGGAALSSCSTR